MTIESTILRAKVHAQGYCEITLSGRCMEPFLIAGDMARIVSTVTPTVGDIALVELDSGLVALHRIVHVSNHAYITKGDFTGITECIPEENVIGVAECFSLDGVHWSKDQRTQNEIAELVRLSIRLSDRSDPATARTRTVIWEFNETARERMLRECACI